MAIIQQVTFFIDDDVTTVDGDVIADTSAITPDQATCSTDPTHRRPYLMLNLVGLDKSTTLIQGVTAISLKSLSVQDTRRTADQNTGWLTQLLAQNLMGCRLVEQQQDSFSGTMYVTVNGIITDIKLDASKTFYTFQVKDIRERERSLELFTRAESTVVFPRADLSRLGVNGPGVAIGYGRLNPSDPASPLLIPPASGYESTYGQSNSSVGGNYFGFFLLDGLAGPQWVESQPPGMSVWDSWFIPLNMTEQDDSLYKKSALSDSVYMNGQFNTGMTVQWRPLGTTDPWTTLRFMPVWEVPSVSWGAKNENWAGVPGFYSNKSKSSGDSLKYWLNKINVTIDPAWGAMLPTPGQRCEVRVLSGLPPSTAIPMFIEMNAGQFLKNCYDGVYSDASASILYDADVMEDLIDRTPVLRAIITETVEDGKTWLEENWYKTFGYIPRINNKGEISPYKWSIPDASVDLPQLDETNCEDADWDHTSDDSVSDVTFTYFRDYLNTGKVFASVEVDNERIDAPGTVRIGAQVLAYTPVTVRDITTDSSGGLLNNAGLTLRAGELGYALFKARAFDTIDRFSLGGQHLVCKAHRSDSTVRGLLEGDWVVAAFPWLPDYQTGLRGMTRLAQIIHIQDQDPLVRQLELVDAGPHDEPLTEPTIAGVDTTVASGRLSVEVTGVPSGASARLDYAATATLPSDNSGDWLFGARILGDGTLITSLVPPGTLWYRVRSEQPGRRASGWVGLDNVEVVDGLAGVGLHLAVLPTGEPQLLWQPTTAVAGFRLYYQVTGPTDEATFPLPVYADIDASIGSYTFPVLRQHFVANLNVEAWSGFASGVVSGTQGVRLPLASVARADLNQVTPTVKETVAISLSTGLLTLTPYDPQLRITRVAFQSTAVDGTMSGWTSVPQPGPYTQDVTFGTIAKAKIGYQVYAYDNDETEQLVEAAVRDMLPNSLPQITSITLTHQHADTTTSTHDDVAHADTAHGDAHTDAAHTDGHSDVHTDTHTDTVGGHGDLHNDVHGDGDLHIDSHNDTPAVHTDHHGDAAHDDSHSDTAHGDAHTDDGHADSAHADTHTDTHGDGQYAVRAAIQVDDDAASVKVVANKTTDPTLTDIRAQPAIDGRNVVVDLIDAATGDPLLMFPGDQVRVGALAYGELEGEGVEGPLALASLGLFTVAPVGVNKWVPA